MASTSANKGVNYTTHVSLCPHLEGVSPPDDGHLYCPAEIDAALLCWNYTKAGTTASQPCPKMVSFIKDEVATRQCLANGEWYRQPNNPNYTWTNFERCLALNSDDVYVYYVGYPLSIVALLIALFIFTKYRQLQCDRVTMHKHLFMAYLLNAIIWLWNYALMGKTTLIYENGPLCIAVHLVANYFSLATYLWMFCEGLYLLIILKAVFVKTRLLVYICMEIGWGVPLIMTIIYGVTRGKLEKPKRCWMDLQTHYMYILIAPAAISLLANFVFISIILHLLLTKLRNPTSPDQQQGRKTAKAVLILVPLLGLQYLVAIVTPGKNVIWRKVHQYLAAILVSFQGLLVAILFCFCNQEVHTACLANSQRLAYTLGLPLVRDSRSRVSRSRQAPTSRSQIETVTAAPAHVELESTDKQY